jgi:transcriptional regulator with XRE-family HTH domain
MAEPTIGARIRAARSALGLTQADVAKKLGLSTTSSVSQWERDLIPPSEVYLADLKKHLFDPAAKLDFDLKEQVSTELNKISLNKPASPKPHTKEQLILSLVELGREKGKYKIVMDLLLGAKAQGYTIDSLINLMTQIEP